MQGNMDPASDLGVSSGMRYFTRPPSAVVYISPLTAANCSSQSRCLREHRESLFFGSCPERCHIKWNAPGLCKVHAKISWEKQSGKIYLEIMDLEAVGTVFIVSPGGYFMEPVTAYGKQELRHEDIISVCDQKFLVEKAYNMQKWTVCAPNRKINGAVAKPVETVATTVNTNDIKNGIKETNHSSSDRISNIKYLQSLQENFNPEDAKFCSSSSSLSPSRSIDSKHEDSRSNLAASATEHSPQGPSKEIKQEKEIQDPTGNNPEPTTAYSEAKVEPTLSETEISKAGVKEKENSKKASKAIEYLKLKPSNAELTPYERKLLEERRAANKCWSVNSVIAETLEQINSGGLLLKDRAAKRNAEGYFANLGANENQEGDTEFDDTKSKEKNAKRRAESTLLAPGGKKRRPSDEQKEYASTKSIEFLKSNSGNYFTAAEIIESLELELTTNELANILKTRNFIKRKKGDKAYSYAFNSSSEFEFENFE